MVMNFNRAPGGLTVRRLLMSGWAPDGRRGGASSWCILYFYNTLAFSRHVYLDDSFIFTTDLASTFAHQCGKQSDLPRFYHKVAGWRPPNWVASLWLRRDGSKGPWREDWSG